MPVLDPALAAILDEMAAAALPAYQTMTPVDARRANEQRNAYWNDAPPPVAHVRELAVPGPRRALRARFYDPAAKPDGIILYLHGCGWVFGSIDTHDGVARRLALGAGRRVLSLDYGLAPEEPFPCGLEDAVAAIRWLRAGADGLLPAAGPVALAGDSAGANLALAACLALRDADEPQPNAAALAYGAFSADLDGPSATAFGEGQHLLTVDAMRWFWDHYLPDPAGRRDPLAAPLYADLSGLPPVFIGAAELDPLRDDSERLARRLIEAGVAFDYRLWRGLTHAVLGWSRRLPRIEGLIAELAGFLDRNLGAATTNA